MVKYCKYCGKELKEEYTAANGYTGWGPCDCPTVTELTKLESEQAEIKRQICACGSGRFQALTLCRYEEHCGASILQERY